MAPIKSVGSTSESDTFVDDVQNDLVGLLNKYESIVQDASREYDRHTKTYNKQVENVNTCLSAICDSCIEAEDIPQWKEHIFLKIDMKCPEMKENDLLVFCRILQVNKQTILSQLLTVYGKFKVKGTKHMLI